MKHPRTYYLVLFLLLLFTACDDDRNEMLVDKLQGDWLSLSNSYRYLSVRDSLILYYDSLVDEYTPFRIEGDTLFIPELNERIYLSSVSEKYISTKENDDEPVYPLFIKADSFSDSNLLLKSVEVRFINQFNIYDRRIIDWTVYFDNEMNCFLKVSDTGNYGSTEPGKSYKTGEYTGELSTAVFENLQDKFRCLPLNKIKDVYTSNNYLPYPNCSGMETSVLYCDMEFELKSTGKINRVTTVIKGASAMPGSLAAFVKPVYDLISNSGFQQSKGSHIFTSYGSHNFID